ncbi:hypothetical protein Leryth_006897 [Lithospermum erythrorhizon]|nr:hypothetical protein Leryth_006897 [Lithospermum erythrorhizon]
MASTSARRILQKSTSAAKSFLSRTVSPPCAASSLGGAASSISPPRISPHRTFFLSRLPVELGCGESLIPLHSVTASALLNSLLSSNVGQWGCLSEGFATPL